MKAIWKDVVIAESDETIVIEGYHYFPPDSVKRHYLQPSTKHTVCHWRGVAGYYNVIVTGHTNKNAAWFYPAPKEAAEQIKNYVAFWNGVDVSD